MYSFGNAIRQLREKAELPLRIVSAHLDIDQAILSKIERGQKSVSKDLVLKLAEFYDSDKDELLILWLSDKVLDEVENEELALRALQVAEHKIRNKETC